VATNHHYLSLLPHPRNFPFPENLEDVTMLAAAASIELREMSIYVLLFLTL
jgi:hypothetical protein